ncbi:MAG: hypothetical protein ACE5H4_05185 [Candidatus Thorarchaeota archaeon]
MSVMKAGARIRETQDAGTLDYSIELDGVLPWSFSTMSLQDDAQSLLHLSEISPRR